jgi:hypothetical protein
VYMPHNLMGFFSSFLITSMHLIWYWFFPIYVVIDVFAEFCFLIIFGFILNLGFLDIALISSYLSGQPKLNSTCYHTASKFFSPYR